jgi:ankyrin repeat protein
MRGLVSVMMLVIAAGGTGKASEPAKPTSADALVQFAADGNWPEVERLLAKRTNVAITDGSGATALHKVVQREQHVLAKRLLKAGAPVNAKTLLGVSPLKLAIELDDVQMVNLLLSGGADPEGVDATGETPLILAARGGSLEIVKALIKAGAAPARTDEGFKQSPLMAAARAGHSDLVRLLIKAGVPVDAQTRTGATPAFRSPKNSAASRGAGIVRSGWPEQGERDPIPGAKTALLYAAREGHADIVAQLLDAGADLELADANGVTPLLIAIVNERLAVATALIERGANVNAVDWYGVTPLFAAVDVRNLDIPVPNVPNGVDRPAALALIERLLAKGAEPNVRVREYPPQRRWITRLGSLAWVDVTGQTPLFRAALAGDVASLRLLVAHGADPSIKTFSGTTPLMAAAGVNWTVAQTFDEGPASTLEAVRYLHSLGIDLDAENSMGIRAIHGAANRGLNDVVRYLVENGASLEAKDAQGRSPMTWAEGVFLATHPPERKPETVALLNELSQARIKNTK